MIAILCLMALAAGGVVLLRLGWDAREPAGTRLTLAGWAAIVAATLALTIRDGAWGLSIAAIASMLAAAVLLGRAALTDTSRARAPREPAPTVALDPQGWRGVARRVGVFLLAVPVSGAVALLACMAMQGTARATGSIEADSTAFGLLAWPVAWAVVATWIMMKPHPLQMLRPLLAIGAPAGLLFWLVA